MSNHACRPALVAGGIMYDPANPASFPLEETANIIRACSEQYIASMLMANIDVQTLSGLSSCTYTPENVPRYVLPHDCCHLELLVWCSRAHSACFRTPCMQTVN